MRFEVPQFIEIEDKIFGPFTWKQFIYLCGGIGIALMLFITAPLIIFIILGIPIGGIALLLAFYPVNNRPFSIFLESVVRFYKEGRIYHWRKNSGNVYSAENHISQTPTAIPVPKKGNGGIHSLSRKLELTALQKSE